MSIEITKFSGAQQKMQDETYAKPELGCGGACALFCAALCAETGGLGLVAAGGIALTTTGFFSG